MRDGPLAPGGLRSSLDVPSGGSSLLCRRHSFTVLYFSQGATAAMNL
jgi:hypothetical protein